MVERVDLHIGREKTGSTSIQRALATSRRGLGAEGVLYPAALGRTNHVKLAALALGEEAPRTDVHTIAGVSPRTSPARFRDRTRRRVQRELRGGRVRHVVLSNEHCASRLGHADVQRLRAWLLETFEPEQMRVIVYLRRQDDLVESAYSTRLRGGAFWPLGEPTDAQFERICDHAALLRRWASVFGAEQIVPRRYGRRWLLDGDVVADALATMGLAGSVTGQLPAGENRALGGGQQELLRLLNARAGLAAADELGLSLPSEPRPDDGDWLRLKAAIARDVDHVRMQLESLRDDQPPARLTPQEAVRVMDRAAAGNAWVAERWFGGGALFPREREPRETSTPGERQAAAMALATELLLARNAG